MNKFQLVCITLASQILYVKSMHAHASDGQVEADSSVCFCEVLLPNKDTAHYALRKLSFTYSNYEGCNHETCGPLCFEANGSPAQYPLSGGACYEGKADCEAA